MVRKTGPSTLKRGTVVVPYATQLGLIFSVLALFTGSASASSTAYCSNVNTGADNKPSMSLAPPTIDPCDFVDSVAARFQHVPVTG